MPDTSFGGATSGGSNSAGTLYSDGIPIPTGRPHAPLSNGYVSQACLITQLWAYLGGVNGTPSGSIQLGSAVSGVYPTLNEGSSGGSPKFGPVPVTPWLVQGGSVRFQWNGPSSGPVYFGHGGGGTTNGPAGFSRAGTLGGGYSWAQAPSPVTMVSVTSSTDGNSATTVFAGGGDDGGAGLIGYRLQRADDAGFTTNVATILVGSGTNVVTGLTPGKQYFWRATAVNAVTEAQGSPGGAWSNVIAVTQQSPARGRINVSGAGWGAKMDARINVAGSGWVEADGKINPDGSGWVPIGG